MAQEIPPTGIELPAGNPAASELQEWIAGLVGTEPFVVKLSSILYAKRGVRRSSVTPVKPRSCSRSPIRSSSRRRAPSTGCSATSLPTALAADVDDQSPEVRTGLSDRLAALEELARQVEARWFLSLDHPDVNPTNVILAADHSWHIIDWEEAMVGCPLFSLDRVLDEVPAGDEGLRREIEDAYLGALGDGDRATLHMAGVIVPLRRAIEARQFARAVGAPTDGATGRSGLRSLLSRPPARARR